MTNTIGQHGRVASCTNTTKVYGQVAKHRTLKMASNHLICDEDKTESLHGTSPFSSVYLSIYLGERRDFALIKQNHFLVILHKWEFCTSDHNLRAGRWKVNPLGLRSETHRLLSPKQRFLSACGLAP